MEITTTHFSYELGLHGGKTSMETGILLKMDMVKMTHFPLVNLGILIV